MYIQINSKKTRTSEAFAIAAMILLSTDTANTFIGQGGYGFLSPLNDQQIGILFGIPSIILFVVSFGFGFREKTRLTSLLLVVGGALLAVSKIVEPIIHQAEKWIGCLSVMKKIGNMSTIYSVLRYEQISLLINYSQHDNSEVIL